MKLIYIYIYIYLYIYLEYEVLLHIRCIAVGDRPGLNVNDLRTHMSTWEQEPCIGNSDGSGVEYLLAEDWKLFTSLPVPPDNLTRLEVNGKRLYATVSYGAPFLPPFVTSSDSDGLFDQLRAALWTALSRATRPFKPFPLFGGMLFPVRQTGNP